MRHSFNACEDLTLCIMHNEGAKNERLSPVFRWFKSRVLLFYTKIE